MVPEARVEALLPLTRAPERPKEIACAKRASP
jgi:hypothetical protein